MDKPVARHVFILNDHDNGGEQVSFATNIFLNEDGDPYYNQEITLHSYCNSASMLLVGAQVGPAQLRELANQLEEATLKAKYHGREESQATA